LTHHRCAGVKTWDECCRYGHLSHNGNPFREENNRDGLVVNHSTIVDAPWENMENHRKTIGKWWFNGRDLVDSRRNHSLEWSMEPISETIGMVYC